ncbi:MFS transporter [Streptomyces sp. NPDC001135]
MTELSRRRRVLVLTICCMSLLIVSLDSSIVNIALPRISTDLHASMAGLQWTVDAYLLVLASLLMLAGSTADRIGRRRTFQIGLAVFTVGSLLCSIAPGLGWLIVFRMVQAVGGSMLNPVAMAIITNTFTDRAERARAIGMWAGVMGVSTALGPVVGGALVDSLGWRAIFWLNVPIGVLAIVLCQVFVPESRAARARRFDPVGQLLVVVLLASLIYATIEGREAGWTSPGIIVLFAVFAAALAVLVPYERRRHEPLVELRFFKSVPFSGASVVAVCGMGAMSGFLFINPLYLQNARGMSALEAGLCTLPIAVMSLLISPRSGRMVARRGPRLPLVIAGVAITLAAVVQTGLDNGTAVVWLLVVYAVFGLGFGMQNPPITHTAMSGMPTEQAGVAAGIISTSRQVGQALGVAVVGSVVTSNLHGSLRTGLAEASHPGWWIITGCGVAVFALGLLTTGQWARRTAEETAASFAPVAGKTDGEPAVATGGAGRA